MRQEGKATEATTNRSSTSLHTYYLPLLHYCPCCTIAPADVIVDLGDGPEDSEYEDLEDEFNE